MKAIKKNLKDNYEGDVIIYCPYCGSEYSAHAGDYWMLPDDYEFKCDCTGEPVTMVLIRKIVQYEEI